mgnify:CR=1 FL=1
MENKIEIISEDDKCYIAKIDGKQVKLFKVDVDEINIRNKNNLHDAAKCLPKQLVVDFINFIISTIEHKPTVDRYENAANRMVACMKQIEKILLENKCSNLMFWYIKNIDPDIYGKAQTFMRIIERLEIEMVAINSLQNQN